MKFVIHEPTTKTARIESVVIDGADGYAKIPKSLGVNKGDIIVFRGTGDPVRLPVGNDGQVLTADSSSQLGVKWADA